MRAASCTTVRAWTPPRIVRSSRCSPDECGCAKSTAGPSHCRMKLPNIPDLRDEALEAALRRAIDNKTKPQGSLGRIEELALQVGLVLGTDRPRLEQAQIVVFAGDHGIAAQGVSAFPAAVTGQMVHNFLAGGAAVSVLARQHGLAMTVVDCGVACDFDPHPRLHPRKVGRGTADSTIAA